MNWREDFEKQFGIASDPFQDFIESLLEQIIEDIPNSLEGCFNSWHTKDFKAIKQQLKSKYLTPTKEK